MWRESNLPAALVERTSVPEIPEPEVAMTAYLLLVLAVLSRFLPLAGGQFHQDWMNFTAVGAVLLYFGARRSWREMVGPLVALAATDFVLTTMVYHYSFQLAWYVPTWIWYISAMALGKILLEARTSAVRVGAASLLGPTSFFLISNYAVWVAGGMYARNLAGLGACYVAAIPFYRNDLIATTLIATTIFAVEAAVRGAAPKAMPVLVRK